MAVDARPQLERQGGREDLSSTEDAFEEAPEEIRAL